MISPHDGQWVDAEPENETDPEVTITLFSRHVVSKRSDAEAENVDNGVHAFNVESVEHTSERNADPEDEANDEFLSHLFLLVDNDGRDADSKYGC